jgi:hypothetical protein
VIRRFAVFIVLACTACSAGGGAVSNAGSSFASTPLVSSRSTVSTDTVSVLAGIESTADVQHLYVGSPASRSIAVYSAHANGMVTPERVIAGANTRLGACFGQPAVDRRGYVYVPNQFCDATGGNPSDVLVFAPGANGNVAPAYRIGGRATLIEHPSAVAVAPDDTVYVSSIDSFEHFPNTNLLRFAPHAMGNISPTASVSERVAVAQTMTFAPNAGLTVSFAAGAPNIALSRIGYYSRSLAASSSFVGYDDPPSIVADPTSNSFLAAAYTTIDRYQNGTSGFYFVPGGPELTPSLVSQLSVSQARAVALDAREFIYVLDGSGSSSKIDVFAPNASGTATPLRTITNLSGDLQDATSMTIGP